MKVSEEWRLGRLACLLVIITVLIAAIMAQANKIGNLSKLVTAQSELIEVQNKRNCLPIKTIRLYIAKEEMFVDKLQRAKEGKTDAILDSLTKYRTLLNNN